MSKTRTMLAFERYAKKNGYEVELIEEKKNDARYNLTKDGFTQDVWIVKMCDDYKAIWNWALNTYNMGKKYFEKTGERL